MTDNKNVIDFNENFNKNFTKKFVDIYIDQGRMAAGKYAVLHCKRDRYEEVKPLIEEEFIKRGYSL